MPGNEGSHSLNVETSCTGRCRTINRKIIITALAIALLAACMQASGAGMHEWIMRLGEIADYSVLSDGGLALASGYGVINLDSEGRQRWQWVADSPVSLIASESGGAVIAAYGSTLVKLDASGKLLWAADTFEKAYSLAILEGGIFVGWEYGLMRFDMSGNLVWEYYRPEDC